MSQKPSSFSFGQVLWYFIRLARPIFLLGSVLLYGLGVGVARYLGEMSRPALLWLGLGWALTLQLSAHFFNEYFDAPLDLDNLNRTLFSGGSGALGPEGLARGVAFWAALICLTFTAVFTVLLAQAGGLPVWLGVLLTLMAAAALFYSLPPLRLSASGYGELTTSVLVANLVPALGFGLQYGGLHRLMFLSTAPITLAHLAMMLAFELPDYASDLKYQKSTLMVRMGWENGMQLHNQLLLGAYILLAISVFSGLPGAIGWPVFFSFPLALFQIWQMRRIAAGDKPNWTALTLNAVALFASLAYLMTYGFWVH